ncbi:MAG TPA: hypothetical protein VGL93_08635 [Streptosporangiaceae bacterium]
MHGRTVPEAIAALKARQAQVGAWMGIQDAPVKRLLVKLEDSAHGTPLLEGAELFDAPRRLEAARALADVATRLTTDGNPDWGTVQDVRDAVVACAAGLRAESVALSGSRPDTADVGSLIVRTRDAEHDRVFEIAQRSRLKQ